MIIHLTYKWLFGFIFIHFLLSCSQTDTQFCECLDAGKKFNSALMRSSEKGYPTKDKLELERLKKAQEAACLNYQNMDGPAMLELMAECEKSEN
jgi:hypothetical protein